MYVPGEEELAVENDWCQTPENSLTFGKDPEATMMPFRLRTGA